MRWPFDGCGLASDPTEQKDPVGTEHAGYLAGVVAPSGNGDRVEAPVVHGSVERLVGEGERQGIAFLHMHGEAFLLGPPTGGRHSLRGEVDAMGSEPGPG